MNMEAIVRLLNEEAEDTTRRYALIDCAADDQKILGKLISSHVQKSTLFTGENAWAADQAAPYLIRLDTQPEFEAWLLENGWGKSWGIFFTTDSHEKKLLSHFRKYFYVNGAKDRNVFFRFYDPRILRDYLPLLTPEETLRFFGPVRRFVLEDDQGHPLAFKRPDDIVDPAPDDEWPVLSPEKKAALSAAWKKRCFLKNANTYRDLGFQVTAFPEENTLTLEDPAGSTAQLTHTDDGVKTVTGEGRTFQYGLSNCGNPVYIIDPAGNRIHIDLKEKENLVQAIRMEDNRKSWIFEYDKMDHLERIDYPDGTCAKLTHDSYGNLVELEDRNGNSTRFELDTDERLTRMVDANGNSIRFDYDDLTLPSQITFADNTTFSFTYTDEGALETFLAGNSQVAEYDIDKETGSWNVRYKDGTEARFEVAEGKIVKAVNDAGTVALSYDGNGRLISETFHGRTITYDHNETGHLTGISTPFGQQLRFERDKEHRVAKIIDWSGHISKVNYGPNGALAAIDYPNGTRLSQRTGPSGLPEQIQLTGPGDTGTLFYKEYQRDKLDRVIRASDAHKDIFYTYDDAGRLYKAKSNDTGFDEIFHIDAKANRLSDRDTQYEINDADRLIFTGRTPCAYDDLGNLTRGTCPRGEATCDYTALNRLKSFSRKSSHAKYAYDAFGRRIAKKVDGVQTLFIWAGGQLLHEVRILSGDSRAKAEVTDYLFFPETPVLLAVRQNRTTRWAAFGQRYETLCLTNEDGTIVWQADYDAFGKAHIETGHEIHQPFRLAGHYHDPESGLHYAGARYFDPGLGRYLSLDPLFLEGGSTNFYAYCDGDPINRIDPTGEFIFTTILIGAAIGAAISAAVEGISQSQAGKGYDGIKIAKAALIGGAVGAIGAGSGAAIQGALAAGKAGSALAATTFSSMGTAGFLEGAGSSVAEQCAHASMGGAGVDPFSMVGQALTDGVIGSVLGLATLGAGGVYARQLRKAARSYTPGLPAERPARLLAGARKPKAKASAKTKKLSRRKNNQSEACTVGDPVNAVTGEVLLHQTDFEFPGRIPLSWDRHYNSGDTYNGMLGAGWQTPADARLEVDEDGLVTFYDGAPGGAVFETLPDAEPMMAPGSGSVLSASADHYQVKLKSGITYFFEKTLENQRTHVVKISDASGNHLSFVRKNQELKRISDNCGRHLDVVYERDRIVKIRHNEKTLVQYHYDGNELVWAADAMGHQRRFHYEKGRLTRHTNRNNLSFHYEYDAHGQCVHAWGDQGLYDYRIEHQPYERLVRVTDSLGHVKTFHHNPDRLPVKVADHLGHITSYTYDDLGRVVTITDPLERTTTYEYDDAGNVTAIIRPDESQLTFVYDENHLPVQTVDPNGKIWEQRFDAQGRLIEKITPLDGRTLYEYNTQGDPIAVTDPKGQTTTFEWDDQGHLSAVTDPSGNTTRYHRDLMGNLTALVDSMGRTTRYDFDEKFRLNRVIRPSGAEETFTWDPEDNLLSRRDPQGYATRFEYTGVNEIARRINPDGTTIAYKYDTEENLTALTNEKGEIHRFYYDHAGRVMRETDFHGHDRFYEYDPAGQLIRQTDPLERTITYGYDPLGRLTHKTSDQDEQTFYTWDPNGNLTAFQSPDVRVERFFDAENNLIAEKTNDFAVQYTYDLNGNRIRRTTSNGNTVQYSYTPVGALSGLKINHNEPLRIQRDALGQITREAFSEYLDRTFAYNEDGLLTHQQINGVTGHRERRYDYDPAGNLTARHDSVAGVNRYDYDPMGRITRTMDPMNQVKHFAYDPAGDLLDHRTNPERGLRSADYQYHTYRFDAAGNLAEHEHEDLLTRFSWDENNRLRTVRKPDGTQVKMAYDALGRRHYKSVDGERTFFNWDGDAVISEKTEDGPAREFVYYPGTFEPLALIDEDQQVFYYHNDPNGLPQELTRPNGEVVWSATYDAMGRVEKLLVEEVEQPLRLLGQYYDKETDLCYNRHRYFAPHICAFISRDPIGFAGGDNVYAYAPNVWGWVDPLGLACEGSQNKGLAGPGWSCDGTNDTLRLPKSVGADAQILLKSRIKDNPYAVRLAESLSQQAQKDVDMLVKQLSRGNANPGIGTNTLGRGFYELRGANAGRVIVKQSSAGQFDIVGKFQGHVRGDSANSRIINRLINDYLGK